MCSRYTAAVRSKKLLSIQETKENPRVRSCVFVLRRKGEVQDLFCQLGIRNKRTRFYCQPSRKPLLTVPRPGFLFIAHSFPSHPAAANKTGAHDRLVGGTRYELASSVPYSNSVKLYSSVMAVGAVGSVMSVCLWFAPRSSSLSPSSLCTEYSYWYLYLISRSVSSLSVLAPLELLLDRSSAPLYGPFPCAVLLILRVLHGYLQEGHRHQQSA